MALLDKIHSPDDFRQFSIAELNTLAEEVRERIVSVVSETGGHLASSLGVVELTLALHYVYQTPTDKIVWDVGHQCYPHKILTGRNAAFPTIRQYGGLSGFPRTAESPYDVFDVGHASTSISVALGLVHARNIRQEKHDVVAVIGDGSMTGGLAFEGLNNAGAQKSNITVILNDNKMSISPNVGALSSYLNRILSDEHYNKLKKDVWELTGRLKGVGFGIRNLMRRVDETVKHLILPGKLFEELGFRYFGPIDGHHIEEMVSLLRKIRKNVSGPVLVHVVTKKGKGYEYAENDAPRFHGVGSFEKETGKFQKKSNLPTYSFIFGKTLCRLAEMDKRVVGITAAMPSGTGMENFAAKFPDRYFDVGIAESHAVTFAGGLAASGLRPVVALYSTFLQRAYDNLFHDVALQKLNVLFCLDRGGLAPDDGPTHHGAFDLSYLRCIPQAVIMAPKDENELQHMMFTALQTDGPVFIRYPRGNGTGAALDSDFRAITVGESEVLVKGEGKVLLLALGEMVERAEQVADILRAKNISPTVVNARFLKPLSTIQLVDLISSHQFVVTLEAGTKIGGFGGAILELMNEQRLEKGHRLLRIAYPDEFIQHGDKELLYKEMGLLPKEISNTIENALE
ncbi:MAG: 1-deoxy-D-xylulose-5-phosphate synthase [Elusimicrobia bacterium RIFOXYB2_FULL_49_7]|nr:MAG: 1-deoxy-D-xylulose-5-phosphate synthase [Elusimicrobia bacterium RIFOXYB2_FULL_49_7]